MRGRRGGEGGCEGGGRWEGEDWLKWNFRCPQRETGRERRGFVGRRGGERDGRRLHALAVYSRRKHAHMVTISLLCYIVIQLLHMWVGSGL